MQQKGPAFEVPSLFNSTATTQLKRIARVRTMELSSHIAPPMSTNLTGETFDIEGDNEPPTRHRIACERLCERILEADWYDRSRIEAAAIKLATQFGILSEQDIAEMAAELAAVCGDAAWDEQERYRARNHILKVMIKARTDLIRRGEKLAHAKQPLQGSEARTSQHAAQQALAPNLTPEFGSLIAEIETAQSRHEPVADAIKRVVRAIFPALKVAGRLEAEWPTHEAEIRGAGARAGLRGERITTAILNAKAEFVTAEAQISKSATGSDASPLQPAPKQESEPEQGEHEPGEDDHDQQCDREPSATLEIEPTKPDNFISKNNERAWNIWLASFRLAGTPGETYWREFRGFETLPGHHVARWSEAHQAIACPIIDAVTDTFVALHRIFVSPEGGPRKGEGGNTKADLGSRKGAGIVLRGDSNEVVYLAEGFATAFAIWQTFDQMVTVIACMGEGNLGKINLPPEAQRIVIVSDKGLEQAAEKAAKLIATDRAEVYIVHMPEDCDPGTDAADIFRDNGKAALSEVLQQELGATAPAVADGLETVTETIPANIAPAATAPAKTTAPRPKPYAVTRPLPNSERVATAGMSALDRKLASAREALAAIAGFKNRSEWISVLTDLKSEFGEAAREMAREACKRWPGFELQQSFDTDWNAITPGTQDGLSHLYFYANRDTPGTSSRLGKKYGVRAWTGKTGTSKMSVTDNRRLGTERWAKAEPQGQWFTDLVRAFANGRNNGQIAVRNIDLSNVSGATFDRLRTGQKLAADAGTIRIVRTGGRNEDGGPNHITVYEICDIGTDFDPDREYTKKDGTKGRGAYRNPPRIDWEMEPRLSDQKPRKPSKR